MKNIKTYEGFLDFFKSKPSADDEIVMTFIKRLKKVKGISPYKITHDPGDRNDSYQIDKYDVDFEDTPIKLWSVISSRPGGFDEQSQDLLIKKGLARINSGEFYGINVMCEGEAENCKAKGSIIKELVKLVETVYKEDKEARRIEHIKINMNDAADLIQDEPVEESLVEEEPEVQEIRDICLELNDIGFTTDVSEIPQFKKEIKIKVTIEDLRNGHRTLFDIQDIKETLERIQDFIIERGYEVGIFIEKKHRNRPIMYKIIFQGDSVLMDALGRILPMDNTLVSYCDMFIWKKS
jgi:hypothetical protein